MRIRECDTALKIAVKLFRMTMRVPCHDFMLRRDRARQNTWTFRSTRLRGEIAVDDIDAQIATIRLYYGKNVAPWVERKMTLEEYHEVEVENVYDYDEGEHEVHKERKARDRESVREYLKRRNDSLLELGLCISCAKRLTYDGHTRCPECLEKQRIASKTHYYKHKGGWA